MERCLNAGDHLTLHRRNRALVEGRTNRLRADPRWIWRVLWIPVGVMLGCVSVYGLFDLPRDDQELSVALLVLVGLLSLVSAGAAAAQTVVATFRDRAHRDRCARLVTGEVTGVEKNYVSTMVATGYTVASGHYEFTIAYRFLTPAGDERTGIATSPAGRWRPKPSPGNQLAILYAQGTEEEVM